MDAPTDDIVVGSSVSRQDVDGVGQLVWDDVSKGEGVVLNSRMSRTKARVCFIHMPKCGGSSLGKALRNSFGIHNLMRGRTIHLDSGASAAAAENLGIDLMVLRRHVLHYHLSHPARLFVHGHFAFNPDLPDKYPDWHFVTMLRLPTRRWLSHYQFNKYAGTSFSIEEDLEAFLNMPRAMALGNEYVRKLLGGLPAEYPITLEDATRAADYLERFHVIGALEEIGLFKAQYHQAFGVKLKIGNHNVTKRKTSPEEIEDEIKGRIEELCRPDQIVYNRALQIIGVSPI